MGNEQRSEIHCHSEFSLLDGFSSPEENLKRASELGLKALAITEHGNQFSYVYYAKASKKYPNVKLLYGVELYESFDREVGKEELKELFDNENELREKLENAEKNNNKQLINKYQMELNQMLIDNDKFKQDKYFHLIALARNEKGRIALNEIVTDSYSNGMYYKPRTDLSVLKNYAEDLVISTACLGSKIAKEQDFNKCIAYINEYKSIFPYFYLEMQSHSSDDQIEYNKKILELSKVTNTDFIITTDSHSATKEDLIYQGRHVQIAHDKDTMSEFYDGCYIQSSEEIHKIMDGQIGEENVSLGISNSNVIPDLIEDVLMPFQSPKLPHFEIPIGFNSDLDYIKHLINQGWKKRNISSKLNGDKQKITEYQDRIKYELDTISSMGFIGYFLIVHDFINWARSNDIAIGEGRGSCAGAMVSYLLGITNADPIEYGLIFERFLNPERVSMPDADIDTNNRSAIIKYLSDKYGKENVCQIINFSYITPVVAIKDVGKILGYSYKLTDAISKFFPYETWEDCIEANPTIYDDYPDYQEWFDVASKITGRLKNVSTHAGGVGIVDNKITSYMGMIVDKKGQFVIQVDKKFVEDIGIIKFDILGLSTLDVIYNTRKDVGLDEYKLDVNNKKFINDYQIYELLSEGKTKGVFQVESSGMVDLSMRLKPKSLLEVSAVLALYRPDTMDILEDYLANRKKSPLEIEYLHEDMKPILQETYGCLVYQEQLMEIVKVFGGRTNGGADLFRKAIGKKDKDLVKQESKKLYNEIIKNGYNKNIAKSISENLSNKGGYSFNKAHSLSYAITCIQTAYLKKYHTSYFIKNTLNKNVNKSEKLNKYIEDARFMNVEILPPNINESDVLFSVLDDKILFGIACISGIGEKGAEPLVQERKTNGDFKSLKDLWSRKGSLSKANIISLIKAGAIPNKDKEEVLKYFIEKIIYTPKDKTFKPVKSLPTKAKLLEEYNIEFDDSLNKEEKLEIYNKVKKEKELEKQEEKNLINYNKHLLEHSKHYEDKEFWEFQTLSTFISYNPFKEGEVLIKKDFDSCKNNDNVVLLAMIADVSKKKTKKDKKEYAFLNLYYNGGIAEGVIWNSEFVKHRHLIVKKLPVAIIGKKTDEGKLTIKEMYNYDDWYHNELLNIKRLQRENTFNF